MLISEVVVRDAVLIAFRARAGLRSAWLAAHAWLKVGQATEFTVRRSVLEYLAFDQRVLCSFEGAFGLEAGRVIRGPVSLPLDDERSRPMEPAFQRWRLNDYEVIAPIADNSAPLRVVYLPLQVALPSDMHIAFTLRNLGDRPLNIQEAMQQAVCWCDAIPYESTGARTWNGTFLVAPGRAMTRHLRLGDMPGIPRTGTHEMSLELGGLRSPPETVKWIGEPWNHPGSSQSDGSNS